MEREPMRPHELAAELAETGYEIHNGRVESARLASLIDISQPVWRSLKAGRFDENEYGHVTFRVIDNQGDYLTPSGDHVDGLDMVFIDPYGRKTELGGIHRLTNNGKLATAYAIDADGQRAVLLPNDRRWNAIVDVTESAIMQALEYQKRDANIRNRSGWRD